MSDKLKTQRGIHRRRTTRRVTSRPVRVPEDRMSSRPPPALEEDAVEGEEEVLVYGENDDSERPSLPPVEEESTAVLDEIDLSASGADGIADEDVTHPRVELTDTMAMLLGRMTSPDEVETNPRIRIASREEESPSVVVTPPTRIVGESLENEFEDTRSEPPKAEPEAVVEELTLEEGDVEESFAVEGTVQPTSTPPPPPTPFSAQKRRPPPPPARSQVPVKRPWWETFFSEDYLSTYVPPTDEQISRQCDFYWEVLGLAPGQAVLDVGCGLGLHAIELARRGCLVVGIDLSLPMITRAAEEAQSRSLRINFLHTDVRQLGFDSTFDAVLCVGTTFGFFDDAENSDVLRRMNNALKPGGKLLLDVVNRDHVIAEQPNLIWFQGDGCLCMEETNFNYYTSQLLLKRTLMKDDGTQSEVDYALRLYSLHEITHMMRHAGLRVLEVSGQEATRAVFFGCHSIRMIVLAARTADMEAKSLRPPPQT